MVVDVPFAPRRLVGRLRSAIRWPEFGRILAFRPAAPAPEIVPPGGVLDLELVLDAADEGPWVNVVTKALASCEAAVRLVRVEVRVADPVLPSWDGPFAVEIVQPVRLPASSASAPRADALWALAADRLEALDWAGDVAAFRAARSGIQHADLHRVRTRAFETAGPKVEGRLLLEAPNDVVRAGLGVVELVGMGTGTLVGLGQIVCRPCIGTRVRRGPEAPCSIEGDENHRLIVPRSQPCRVTGMNRPEFAGELDKRENEVKHGEADAVPGGGA